MRDVAVVALAVILVVAVTILVRPADLGELTPTAHPTTNYAEALAA